MATIAEFHATTEAFPLGGILQARPDVTVELERVVPTGGPPIPKFWVRDWAGPDVEAAVGEHPAVRSVSAIDEVDGDGLFRCEWNLEAPGVVGAIGRSEVTLLRGTGTDGGWSLELRARDREALVAFQRNCADDDIAFTVRRLLDATEHSMGSWFDLTPSQYEALMVAFQSGYFDHPRPVSLAELADRLGISRQAFADRLRRGHRNLLSTTIGGRRAPRPRRRSGRVPDEP